MDAAEFDALLERTLADGSLSRGERQALQESLAAELGRPERLLALRARAFEVARRRALDEHARGLVGWCEEIVKALTPVTAPTRAAPVSEACFSPGTACREKITALIASARSSIDVCVFTITDDRIADALLAAHVRRVPVRVVSDDSKEEDPGSDLPRLRRAGVAVAIDRTPKHMHHKFALFDRRVLLTGSYNWTRGAAEENEENLIVTGEAKLVGAFTAEFERLWASFAS